MKHKLIKPALILYVVLSSVTVLFFLERIYRNTIVNYGIKAGEDRMIESILTSMLTNPCNSIEISNKDKSVTLVGSECDKQ